MNPLLTLLLVAALCVALCVAGSAVIVGVARPYAAAVVVVVGNWLVVRGVSIGGGGE